MVQLSVIMPTYNRANGVRNAITAVLNSSYRNFELLIINDGSSNNTKDVLENLALTDNRIQIIHKSNRGVSSARNTGLEKAIGEFIVFVDDDDLIDTNHLQNLMNESYDYDIILDSYCRQSDCRPMEIIHYPQKDVLGNCKIIEFIFGEMQSYPYCFFSYAKRFRSSIIKANNIRYNTNINMGEDRPFLMDYLKYCNSIKVIDTHSYLIQDVSSATYRLSKGKKSSQYLWDNFIQNYQILKTFYKDTHISSVKKYADNYLAEKLFWHIMAPIANGIHLPPPSRKILQSIRYSMKNISICNISDKRVRINVLMIRLLGYQLTLKILKYKFK